MWAPYAWSREWHHYVFPLRETLRALQYSEYLWYYIEHFESKWTLKFITNLQVILGQLHCALNKCTVWLYKCEILWTSSKLCKNLCLEVKPETLHHKNEGYGGPQALRLAKSSVTGSSGERCMLQIRLCFCWSQKDSPIKEDRERLLFILFQDMDWRRTSI